MSDLVCVTKTYCLDWYMRLSVNMPRFWTFTTRRHRFRFVLLFCLCLKMFPCVLRVRLLRLVFDSRNNVFVVSWAGGRSYHQTVVYDSRRWHFHPISAPERIWYIGMANFIPSTFVVRNTLREYYMLVVDTSFPLRAIRGTYSVVLGDIVFYLARVV